MIYLFIILFLSFLQFYFNFLFSVFFCFLILFFMMLLSGPEFFSFFFGYDLLSVVFMILTIYLTSLVFLSSVRFTKEGNLTSSYLFLFVLLGMSIFVCFSSGSMLIFFFFFECSVVPIFLLVLGWGYKKERLQAGFYLFLYTFVFSLFFLLFLLGLMYWMSVYDFSSFNFCYGAYGGVLTAVCCFMFFLVKIPCYFIHLWLPKAHVEATSGGSMILAGILLKLGGYGLFRFSFFFENFNFLLSVLMFLGMLGGFYAAINCMRQVDLKCLIAYMSVSHMGFMFGSYCTFNFYGFMGLIFMMFCHGLSSSGLFFLVGLIYERFSTRSLLILKSSLIYISGVLLWAFVLVFCNMACPPSFNFFSELFLLWGLLKEDFMIFWFLFSSLMMFGCFTSIHLFVSLAHGSSKSWLILLPASAREMIVFFLHLFPLFALVVFFN